LGKLVRAGLWPNNKCSNGHSEGFKARSQTVISEESPPISEITSFPRSHIPELVCPRESVPIDITENHEATFPKALECAHKFENDYNMPTQHKLKSSVEEVSAQLLIKSQPSSSGVFSLSLQVPPGFQPIPRNASRTIGSHSKSKLSMREYPRGCQAVRGRSVKSQEKLSRFLRRGEEFPGEKLNNGRGRRRGARRFRGGRCGEPQIINSH